MCNMRGIEVLNQGKFFDVLNMLDEKGSLRTEEHFRKKFLEYCNQEENKSYSKHMKLKCYSNVDADFDDIIDIPDLLPYYDIKFDMCNKWRKIRHSSLYEQAEVLIFNFNKENILESGFALLDDNIICEKSNAIKINSIKNNDNVMLYNEIDKGHDYKAAIEKCKNIADAFGNLEIKISDYKSNGSYNVNGKNEKSKENNIYKIIKCCEEYVVAKFIGILAEVVSEFPTSKKLYLNIVENEEVY